MPTLNKKVIRKCGICGRKYQMWNGHHHKQTRYHKTIESYRKIITNLTVKNLY